MSRVTVLENALLPFVSALDACEQANATTLSAPNLVKDFVRHEDFLNARFALGVVSGHRVDLVATLAAKIKEAWASLGEVPFPLYDAEAEKMARYCIAELQAPSRA